MICFNGIPLLHREQIVRRQWLEVGIHVVGGGGLCNNPNQRLWYPSIAAMKVRRCGHIWIHFEGDTNRIPFCIGYKVLEGCEVKSDSKVPAGMELPWTERGGAREQV